MCLVLFITWRFPLFDVLIIQVVLYVFVDSSLSRLWCFKYDRRSIFSYSLFFYFELPYWSLSKLYIRSLMRQCVLLLKETLAGRRGRFYILRPAVVNRADHVCLIIEVIEGLQIRKKYLVDLCSCLRFFYGPGSGDGFASGFC